MLSDTKRSPGHHYLVFVSKPLWDTALALGCRIQQSSAALSPFRGGGSIQRSTKNAVSCPQHHATLLLRAEHTGPTVGPLKRYSVIFSVCFWNLVSGFNMQSVSMQLFCRMWLDKGSGELG